MYGRHGKHGGGLGILACGAFGAGDSV